MFTCRRTSASAWVVTSPSTRLGSPRPRPIPRRLANLSRRDAATNKTAIIFPPSLSLSCSSINCREQNFLRLIHVFTLYFLMTRNPYCTGQPDNELLSSVHSPFSRFFFGFSGFPGDSFLLITYMPESSCMMMTFSFCGANMTFVIGN